MEKPETTNPQTIIDCLRHEGMSDQDIAAMGIKVVPRPEPGWRSQRFRDGMVGAGIVLLPIFLWVVIHG